MFKLENYQIFSAMEALLGSLIHEMDSDSDGGSVGPQGLRRSMRSALSDVSSRVPPLPVTPVMNLMSTLPTPSPSPDELIILQRGRRKVPVTWSPDIKRTPIKVPGSPSRSCSIVLRSSPRKRLLLGDETPPQELTPRKVSRMLGRLDALNLSQVRRRLSLLACVLSLVSVSAF
jgi:hypothetical protein